MSASTPVRHPDVHSTELMTRRAWWLVGLNLVIPGSAQVLAGSRRLGRFALATTLSWWALLVVGLALAIGFRPVLTSLLTNPFVLGAVVIVLAGYAVLWVVLTLDTLRLVRLVRVQRAARLPVALLALVTTGALVAGAGFVGVRAVSAIGLLESVFSGGQIAEPIDGRYNILLLGGDAGPDRLGLRPDSISVVSVDAETGATTILGIPRNLQSVPFSPDSPLWAPFPNGYDCGVECLISYLYTYGEEHPELYPDADASGSSPGVEAMRDAVEGVFDLQLQYFVLIDMQGFAQLIDALGGIDIEVTQRLPIEGGEDANGQPINVHGWIEPGPQHMDGYTALWYARSRHGTSDYDRMSRQREVQRAILEQMDPGNVLLRFTEIAEAGTQVVSTDIPQPMLSHFAELAILAKDQPIVTHDFVPPEVHPDAPDYDEIHARVDELLSPVTPSPSG